jgi:hypothetical protein
MKPMSRYRCVLLALATCVAATSMVTDSAVTALFAGNSSTITHQWESIYIEPLAQDRQVHRITYDQLVSTMSGAVDNYNVLVTTNAGRFQSEVLLTLIRRYRSIDPTEAPFFIHAEDWYNAFITATGISEDEAPSFVSIPKRNQQKTLVDYSIDRVISKVNSGRRPILAANVMVWWPEEFEYQYMDRSTDPHLQVTNISPVTYRLLDFGNKIVVDEIEGIKGRPTTGALGALFKALGNGSIKWSRFAIAPDGTLVMKAKAKKAFASITSTVTVFSDGNAVKGIPKNRPDLERAADYLEVPIELEYVDLGIDR